MNELSDDTIDKKFIKPRYILTGGIASGKSTTLNMMKEYGIEVIDADVISHKVFAENEDAIREVFELTTSGDILRKEVSDLIFSKPKKRFQLEALLHPIIKSEISKQEKELQDKVYVIDIPLYFEKRSDKQDGDFVITLDTNYETQVVRLMKRNNFTKDQADKRILSQIPNAVKVKKADYVLYNSGTIDELKSAVKIMLDKVFSKGA